MNTRLSNENGYALLVAAGALAAIGVLGIGMVLTSRSAMQAARNEAAKTRTHLKAAGVLALVSQDFKNDDGNDFVNAEAFYLPLAGAGACAQNDQAAELHWTFDEQGGSVVGDSSGHSIDGSLSSISWESAGNHCGAAQFDGSNSVAYTNSLTSIDCDSLTVCAWVFANDVTNTRYVWFTDESGGYGKLRLFASSGQWKVSAGTGSTNQQVGAAAEANVWVHLAAVFETGGNVRLYINGSEAGSAGYDSRGGRSASSYIGAEANRNYWAGLIDDVRVYARVLSPAQIDLVMNGGAIESAGGSDSADARYWVLGADTVDYYVEKITLGMYTIATEAYGGNANQKKYPSALGRRLSFRSSTPVGPTSSYVFFQNSFTLLQDAYMGYFNDEWAGLPPKFTGNIRVGGQLTLDKPSSLIKYYAGEGGTLQWGYAPVYFGYDFDGDGDIEDLEDTPVQRQGTCRIYTIDGILHAGSAIDRETSKNPFMDSIFINTNKDDHGHVDFADPANQPHPSDGSRYLVYKLDSLPDTLDNMSYDNIEAFIDSFDLASRAQEAGGVYMTSCGTNCAEGGDKWFFDWNVRKRADLWQIDFEMLIASLPSDFNGFIYVENPSAVENTTRFQGVQLVNCKIASPPQWVIDKGITFVTPHALYTVGEVNTGQSDPIDLLLISDSYTVLSNSWMNVLCQHDSDPTDHALERTLYLHVQQVNSAIERSKCKMNNLLCHYQNQAHCPDFWTEAGSFPGRNVVDDVNDLVTNWFFYDRDGMPLRREPINDRSTMSAANNWNHFDDHTTIKAYIVSGYSYPDDYNPVRAIQNDPADNTCGKRWAEADNTSVLGGLPASCYGQVLPPFAQDKSRMVDAIHFLEAWVGRYGGGDQWKHDLHLWGSLNLLYPANNQGIAFGGTLEASLCLIIDPALFTSGNWLQERDEATGCPNDPGDYNSRQFKFGSCSPPEIRYQYIPMYPPGFGAGTSVDSTVTASSDNNRIGSWRRSYGDID